MRYHGDPTAQWLLGKQKQVTISLNDMSSLSDAISKFVSARKDVQEAAAEAVEILCAEGEKIAKSYCPVDTGELQNSITHKTEVIGGKVEGVIEAGTDHAMFVEFGTGVKGKGTYPGDDKAWEYDVKRQNWQGRPANPFMYYTARDISQKAEEILNGDNH